MSRDFSQQLQQAIDERMAAGGYASVDHLLLDAMLALRHIEQSQEELRAEIRERLDRRGKPAAQPLDFEALKAELRASLRPTS
jgi:Arc/MetJ-type ribon-helix-helix transcriptional regulator